MSDQKYFDYLVESCSGFRLSSEFALPAGSYIYDIEKPRRAPSPNRASVLLQLMQRTAWEFLSARTAADHAAVAQLFVMKIDFAVLQVENGATFTGEHGLRGYTLTMTPVAEVSQ